VLGAVFALAVAFFVRLLDEHVDGTRSASASAAAFVFVRRQSRR
jgi:hypothetical protein